MTEAMLGVDSQNPTGALGLYEGLGFVVHSRGTTYRRPLDGSPLADPAYRRIGSVNTRSADPS